MSKGSTTSKQELPEWQKKMYEEAYSLGKGVSQQPFIPYTGAQVAGFNPDQLRQFESTRGMVGASQQYDPRAGLQALATAPTPTISPVTGRTAQIGQVAAPQAASIQAIPTFGGATIQQLQGPTAAQIGTVQAPQFRGLLDVDMGAYQSPYQQQVIDFALQDIQRQSDIARGQAQSRAIGAGAFGGSRSALIESEATRPFAEQAARTAASLRQSGFQQAQQAAQADLARQQQLGVFGAEQEQQRALQQAQLEQQAGLTGFGAERERALRQADLAQQAGLAGYQGRLSTAQRQADLAQQAGLAGQDIAAQRAIQQAQLGQQAGLAGFQAQQQRALEQARLGQQAGLAGQDIAAQRNLQQAQLQQQAGLRGYEGDLQRSLQQGQFAQQAGLLGAEQAQARALEQARLAQQTGMAELDIAGRTAMMQPELELRARQQQAGLLGGQLEDQYRALGLLGGVGQQQQQLQQRAMDQAYNEFLRASGYGQQQLSTLLSGLSGMPSLISTRDKKKTGAGDVLGTIAGLFS